jgi:hypothetical protein
VADATLERSESLFARLKEINNTAKVLKTQEMELELHMHQEEMLYEHGNDEKLLENAQLSLLNQGVVVAAMASFADAIRDVQGPLPSSPPPSPRKTGLAIMQQHCQPCHR